MGAAKDFHIEEAIMHETYQQAGHSNDGRPTCRSCHAPCAYDRDYRGQRLCPSCARDEFPGFTLQHKELLCKPPSPPTT